MDNPNSKLVVPQTKRKQPSELLKTLNCERKTTIKKEELERLYWDRKLGMHKIATEKNKSYSTIRYWMRKYRIKRRDRFTALKLTPWGSKDVNLQPSPELAYILGVLKGDGSVWYNPANRGYIARLKTSSCVFAQSFANALKQIGLNPSFRFKKYWYVDVRSKAIYGWYKNLSTEKLTSFAEKFKVDFIRGFYESEGLMWRNINGGYYIGMWNKNLKSLLLVKDLLKELGFNFKIFKHKEIYYSLLLSTGKGREGGWKSGEKKIACLKFIEVINPCIKKLQSLSDSTITRESR
jgi:intein-encoded DNA endonuclease-like protein